MSDKQTYHNQGEKDAAAGYDSRRPNGFIELLVIGSFSSSADKRMREENEAYENGYRNGQKQKDE